MWNQKILRQPIEIKWIDCYIDEIFFFVTFQNFVSQILNKMTNKLTYRRRVLTELSIKVI